MSAASGQPFSGQVRAMKKNASHHANTPFSPLPNRPMARSSVALVPRLIYVIASRCSWVNTPSLATTNPGHEEDLGCFRCLLQVGASHPQSDDFQILEVLLACNVVTFPLPQGQALR